MKFLNTLFFICLLVCCGVLAGYGQVSITCPDYFDIVVDADPDACAATLTEYGVTATVGSSTSLPAHYPLYDDLLDTLGNAGTGYINNPALVTPPAPGAPLCIPSDGGQYTDGFRTSSFPGLDVDGFKFSVEFKLNGYSGNSLSGPPILMLSLSFRWIGIFTSADGKIGISYLNQNYPESNTTVNLQQWYKAEVIYDAGIGYLYLDDVLIQTVVIGPLEYPQYKLEDYLNSAQFLTYNAGNGRRLDGCIRNVKVANLNEVDSEPEEITITYNVPDVFQVGYTFVIATATTASSGSASCVFYVQVRDKQAPTAVCKNSTVTIQPGGYTYLSDDVLLDYDLSYDNCLRWNGDDNFYISGRSHSYVTCQDVGSTLAVTVSVNDYSYNSSTCTAMITVEDGSGLPGGWTNTNIGTAAGSVENTICSPSDDWIVASNGPSYGSQDKMHYAWRTLCGNGEIVARVTDITNSGVAGVTFRQNSTAGSPMVRLETQLTNFVRREVRMTQNGMINSQQAFAFNRNWLKIVRQGNTYISYTSQNGTNWQYASATTVNLGNCVQVGLYAEGINVNSTAVATFDHVSVSNTTLQSSPDVDQAVLQQPGNGTAGINVYPNPASTDVRIDLYDFAQETLTLTLLNNLGQTIRQEQLAEVDFATHTLDLSQVGAGVYFIRLERPDGTLINKRLVVQQ